MLSLVAQAETQESPEVAALFDLKAEGRANVTMKDIVIFPSVQIVKITNASVVESVTPIRMQNLAKTFTGYFQIEADDFNQKYKKGWSLANIDPRLAMLGGLIKNITISPYVSDHWLYAGMSMYADKPIREGMGAAEPVEAARSIVQTVFDFFGVRDWIHSYAPQPVSIELDDEFLLPHGLPPMQDDGWVLE